MAKIKFRLNTISNQKLRDPVIKYIGANNFKKLSKEEGELKALNVYQKRKRLILSIVNGKAKCLNLKWI